MKEALTEFKDRFFDGKPEYDDVVYRLKEHKKSLKKLLEEDKSERNIQNASLMVFMLSKILIELRNEENNF